MLLTNQLIGFGSSGVTDPFFIGSSVDLATASSTSSTLTWTHTTTSDTKCLIIAGATINNGGTLHMSTPTFNGISLTLADSITTTDGTRIYYLLNPPIGTYTISAPSTSTNDRFFGAFAMNLGEVYQLNATAKTNSGAETISTTINTTRRSILVAAGFGAGDGSTIPTISITSPSGTTLAETTSNQSNNFGKRASLFYTPIVGSGSTTITQTITNTTVAANLLVVAAFSL